MHKFSFIYDRFLICRRKKNELLLFYHCCFLFESGFFFSIDDTTRRIRKSLIDERIQISFYDLETHLKIPYRMMKNNNRYSFWKNYSFRFLSTNGKSFVFCVVCGFEWLRVCGGRKTNAQFIGATMAYGDKQLRHLTELNNMRNFKTTYRIAHTSRICFFFFFDCANGSGKRVKSNWCICVSAAWLQRSKDSAIVMTTEMMMIPALAEQISQNPKIYKF